MKLRINGNDGKQHSIDCHKIKLPMFRCSVCVIDKTQAKEMWKYWTDTGADGITYDYLEESSEVLIILNKDDGEVIVHESVHAVDIILNHIGHKKNKIDEVSAYLTGYIYKEIVKKIKPL